MLTGEALPEDRMKTVRGPTVLFLWVLAGCCLTPAFCYTEAERAEIRSGRHLGFTPDSLTLHFCRRPFLESQIHLPFSFGAAVCYRRFAIMAL